jgi:hypothetical protein
MPNIMKMMKQVSNMQKKMQGVQDDLKTTAVEFGSGGGAVTVRGHADGQVTEIAISPDVVQSGDVGMLEDLVLAAVQGFQAKAGEVANSAMGAVTAGLNLPPGFGF